MHDEMVKNDPFSREHTGRERLMRPSEGPYICVGVPVVEWMGP